MKRSLQLGIGFGSCPTGVLHSEPHLLTCTVESCFYVPNQLNCSDKFRNPLPGSTKLANVTIPHLDPDPNVASSSFTASFLEGLNLLHQHLTAILIEAWTFYAPSLRHRSIPLGLPRGARTSPRFIQVPTYSLCSSRWFNMPQYTK